MNKRLPCSQGLGTGLRGWPDSNAASPSRLGEARRTSTGGPAELQAHTIERSEALHTIVKRHRTSFRSLPCRGRRRAVSAARMKPVGRRKGILQGFVERVFLVPALATGASAIVLMRFASRLRKQFDFSVYAPSPNSITRRHQRASAPPLPPRCAEQLAIAAQSLADPD